SIARAKSGSVSYSNVFFTAGVAEPLIITEDQAGFVDRDRGFVMPLSSQMMGQITSDFFTSPFTYSLALPVEPQGSLRDVDQDGGEDTGIQIYAIAYWTNTFGDSYLEKRDLGGGGWSTAYASTRVGTGAADNMEIIGGKLLIYAPDDQQGFPSAFGADGFLFTEDDPIVGLPQGYTVVDLDTDPFTFDRSQEQTIDLIEGEFSVLNDFSQMSYTEAFDAMIDLMSREYAFTELKGIDWEAKAAEFRPRFEQAEADQDPDAYRLALRDYAWSIPDTHIAGPFDQDLFMQETGGGLGMAIRDVDDGRVLVNFVLDGGPAAEAGIKERAEIVAINGTPINDFVSANVPWSGPFSNEKDHRLQQLRYAIRFPVGTAVEVTYQNKGDTEPTTVTLTTIEERASLSFSSSSYGITGLELPVEFDVLDSGYGYVKIYSFFDNERLTAELWERMIQTMNDYGIPGLIVDMRQNGGGSGFLADQMAGYFFDEQITVGNTGYYAKDINDFFFNPETIEYMYPPEENLRYHGALVVLVGPGCASACEFFSYAMTLQDRATVVGQYPTAGAGGSVDQFAMPEGEFFQYTIGRAVNAEGEIHIEGTGVVPDVLVPVTEETLFSATDPVLDAAVATLDDMLAQ
ncbi:MAG TPA: S41 family peptidase, partial [Aggregatilineaceae bacterium]|nr:S41 family peptidase [Aggregatilineaceae bacterium]